MAQSQTNKQFSYHQRDPSRTLIYQTIRDHWPQFQDICNLDGKGLPDYVKEEFESYLRCGQLYYGFTRRQCESCHKGHLLPFSCKKRGFCPSCCSRRSAETTTHLIDNIIPEHRVRQWVVTLPVAIRYMASTNKVLQDKIHKIIRRAINNYYESLFPNQKSWPGAISFCQRFGSALNLNLHWHILYLDGVYYYNSHGELKFKNSPSPSNIDIDRVLTNISQDVIKLLQKEGILDKEQETILIDYDTLVEIAPSYAKAKQASTINYIGLGQNAGYPVKRIGRGLGYTEQEVRFTGELCGEKNGFTLHAKTKINATDRQGLERLISYMSRPPVAKDRLSKADNGDLIYRLKKPFSDGTHSIQLTPTEFIEKLVALVPPKWLNMVKYIGVFAPPNKQILGS